MECNDVPADSLDNTSLASICSWQTVDMFEGRLKDGHSGSSSYVAMKVSEKIRGEGGIFGEIASSNCLIWAEDQADTAYAGLRQRGTHNPCVSHD